MYRLRLSFRIKTYNNIWQIYRGGGDEMPSVTIFSSVNSFLHRPLMKESGSDRRNNRGVRVEGLTYLPTPQPWSRLAMVGMWKQLFLVCPVSKEIRRNTGFKFFLAGLWNSEASMERGRETYLAAEWIGSFSLLPLDIARRMGEWLTVQPYSVLHLSPCFTSGSIK